jgi:hypothetical protein
MHRDSIDAKLLARAQNTQCYFAAIGYQDLVEHVFLRRAANGSGEWCER